MIITILFVFFVLPISTILLAIVLQNILKCPYLVAITFFAIYLIVAFAAFSSNLAVAIIAAIVYTILAFITAYAVNFINILRQRLNNIERENNETSNNGCCCSGNNNESNNDNLLRISCSCQNGESNDLLTISSSCNSNTNCGCNGNDENNNDTDSLSINANLTPCPNNGGRTGWVRGCYRRR